MHPHAVRLVLVSLQLALLAGGHAPLWAAPLAPPARAQAGDSASGFDEAARRAAAARDTGDADEALRWYRRGVMLRPGWDEGWWYIGALCYETGRPAEAAEAFARFCVLKPDSGAGFAMRGLADFDAGRYDAAKRHLAQALRLPSVGNLEIRNSVYEHLALLHIRDGTFELAVEPLTLLARTQPETPSLVAACGLVLLRERALPSAIPAERREIVEAAGRAGYAALAGKAEARERFEEAIRRFPRTAGLHYGYGGFLRQQGADQGAAAIAQFQKAIEADPASVYPRLEIAFELMRQGDHAAAVPYAEAAVRLAPALFVSHFALGRALVGAAQLDRGIACFEKAVGLAPDVPEARAALARAYVQAGRRADAERQRVAFQKLQAARPSSRLPSFAREETAAVESSR